MESVLRAIRGATTIDRDVAEQVTERTQALVREIFAANELGADDIVSMIVTVTSDISAPFPATAARALGLGDVALLGAVEAEIVGAPPRCIRVLVHCYSPRARADLRHVYLEGASRLREELAARAPR